MNDTKDFISSIEGRIGTASIPEEARKELLRTIAKLKGQNLNILTGATGSGKRSSINALFETEAERGGTESHPETMKIQMYVMDGLPLWDSPGLGGRIEADRRHATGIAKLLNEKDDQGDALINLVLVVLNGASHDLSTSYELIIKVVVPNRGAGQKGRHRNSSSSTPDDVLSSFLNNQARSIQGRLLADTDVMIPRPVCYSAEHGYNVHTLLDTIIDPIPAVRRPVRKR